MEDIEQKCCLTEGKRDIHFCEQQIGESFRLLGLGIYNVQSPSEKQTVCVQYDSSYIMDAH